MSVRYRWSQLLLVSWYWTVAVPCGAVVPPPLPGLLICKIYTLEIQEWGEALHAAQAQSWVNFSSVFRVVIYLIHVKVLRQSLFVLRKGGIQSNLESGLFLMCVNKQVDRSSSAFMVICTFWKTSVILDSPAKCITFSERLKNKQLNSPTS